MGLVTLGEYDDIERGKFQTEVTDFIKQVHDHGLKAHAFTFRNEYMKLYWDHGQDPYSQLKDFLDLGIDGYFTDFPLTVRRFLHYEDLLCTPLDSTKSGSSQKSRGSVSTLLTLL